MTKNVLNIKKQDIAVKIVLVGDKSSGKSLLLKALRGNTSQWDCQTLGVEFCKISVMSADEKKRTYHIWEIGGRLEDRK